MGASPCKQEESPLIDSLKDIDYPMVTEEAGFPLAQKPSVQSVLNQSDPVPWNSRDPIMDFMIFNELVLIITHLAIMSSYYMLSDRKSSRLSTSAS